MNADPTFFSIARPTRNSAEPFVPWQVDDGAPRYPEELRDPDHKDVRSQWHLTHDWHLMTAFEGTNALSRVSKENPAIYAHGIIADIDEFHTPATIGAELRNKLPGDAQPTCLCESPSRNADGKTKWRAVWVFESRLCVSGAPGIAEHWLEHLVSKTGPLYGLFKIKKFDDKAFLRSTQTYIWTEGWHTHSGELTPIAVAQRWFQSAATSYDYVNEKTLLKYADIPLEKIKELLTKKYPHFPGCWPGLFILDSQGPSFWVPGSTSEKSAVVKSSGIITFAAHADKTFYNWAELVGEGNLREFRENQVTEHVVNVYFDGLNYWRLHNLDNRWRPEKWDTLAVQYKKSGLRSSKSDEEVISPLEDVRATITDHNRVDQAGPALFKPPGLWVDKGGMRKLNTSNCKLMPPADELTPWGEGGKFPWLSSFYDSFFGDPAPHQKSVFLTWQAWCYRSAYERDLQPGQAMILMGAPESGKTLMLSGILGESMGGYSDCNAYVAGETSFNSELFSSPIWAVDDSALPPGRDSRDKFTTQLKKLVANYQQKVNGKYEKVFDVMWFGRIVICLNNDEESRRHLPLLTTSSRDKIIMLSIADRLSLGEQLAFPCRRRSAGS